jgi:hypothetical protein
MRWGLQGACVPVLDQAPRPRNTHAIYCLVIDIVLITFICTCFYVYFGTAIVVRGIRVFASLYLWDTSSDRLLK